MVVPKLRFKEFESTVEVRKLGNISNIVVGFVGTVSDQYCDQNEGIPFVRTQNVRDGYFSVENLEYVTRDFHKKNKKSQIFNGDVLIARVGANMGMVCAVENLDTEANCANVIIIKNNAQLNSQYLSLFLNSENGQKQIHSGGAGGAQAVFNTTLAKEISFPYFPLEEQTKIASFLSAVDEKISQLTQKHALLSQYKQGMMQKLFSQQLRFKADDGSEFGEFKQKCIKDLNLYISDGNYGELYPTASQFETVGIPFIRANNIKNLRITNDDMRFINEDLNRVLVSGHLKENDILITTRGDIGMLALVDKQHENSNINAQICLLRVLNSKELDSLYLLYFLHSSFGQKQFKELQTGTALKQLPKKNLNQIIVLIPCLEEQTKIANCLSAIDQKIEIVAQQIEQAKQWKKGLLQQMFV